MEILILGAGDIGYQLAKRLSLDKHNIVMIERDAKRAAYARDHLDAFVIQGDASNYQTLREARIDKADIFAAITNNDEVNLIACRIAKKVGGAVTIARVRNPEYTRKDYILTREELGADMVIQPEKEAANAIVRLIHQSSATDLVEIEEGKIQVIGIRLDADCPLLEVALKDIGKKYGNPPMRIIALKRRQKTIIPKGDNRLMLGDQLFITCDPEFLEQALGYFGKSDTKVEDIMIIGGGMVGKFIAQQLEKDLNIKIIESNEEKALKLADELQNTLVIHGDGSDIDLLNFEGISQMDELISVTGDDETNIITNLVSHHLRVPRTIALLRKIEYLSLTPAIGIESVVSKQLLTVNAIEKFIRSRQIAFFAEIPGVDAEIIEFIPKDNSKIVKKPLKNVKFPANAIIGAVLKDENNMIIPTGDHRIDPGDKVVVFSLPQAIRDVEKMF
jgi:trk system potassium uptake protein TrkA